MLAMGLEVGKMELMAILLTPHAEQCFAPYFGPFTCSPNSSPNLFVLQGISIPHSVIFMRGFFFDEAGFRIPSSRRLPVNFRQVCLTNYFCGNLLVPSMASVQVLAWSKRNFSAI